MPRLPVVARVFAFLHPRRYILGLFLVAGLIAALIGLRQATIAENIDAMLPDDGSRLAEDFRLLSHAPLLSKVLVVLERDAQMDLEHLTKAAQSVRLAAGPPWFTPMTEAEQPTAAAVVAHLLRIFPAIATEQDLARIEAMLEPEAVRHSLKNARESLVSLQGLGLKRLIRSDPLQFRLPALEKLVGLDLFGNASNSATPFAGFFLSADQHSALIVLDTSVAITDARGSQDMLAHLEQIMSEFVPDDMNRFVISGHAYTAANAATIHRDLSVVLTASVLGILALFLLFLRTWRALLVHAVPLAAMVAGAAATMAGSSAISGITLGFGAVLMGLSVDYGLHVWFGLHKGADPGRTLAAIAKPVFFCWLTTAGVFSLLLFSSLPGQRQLALFTVAGLSAAMILALTALPVFLVRKQAPAASAPTRKNNRLSLKISPTARGYRVPILSAFVILLGTAVLCWPAIRFDGRLQALTLVPPELAEAEQSITTSWGGVRSLAMLFSHGENLDAALSESLRLHDYLSRALPHERIISLAPLMPPQSVQLEAIRRWKRFWAEHGPELHTLLLRESADLGFAPRAFAPFLASIVADPQPVTVQDLHLLGLKELTDMLILPNGDAISILTLVPDSAAIQNLFDPEQDHFTPPPPATRLVSPELIGREIAKILHRDMIRFLIAAGFFVLLAMCLLFRNPRRAAQALTPALAGLSALIVAVTVLDIAFNLYSIAATFLVLGLGVDYGIFMAMRGSEDDDLGTEQAVLVSGLTTVVGFGALVLAQHPALHSIGLTVLIGIAAAVPAALVVVPALEGQNSVEKKESLSP